MSVSKAGYYKWLKRKPTVSEKRLRNLNYFLNANVNHKRVYCLMKLLDLKPVIRWKLYTSKPHYPLPNLRKILSKTFEKVRRGNIPIEMTINKTNDFKDGVVILSKREYERMQEELYLERSGTLDYVYNLMETSCEDDFEEF